MDDAILTGSTYTPLIIMVSGYRKSADLLVDHAMAQSGDRDFLVWPIIFCYRHFLELSLKTLIAMYGRGVGVAAHWNSHDLVLLWKSFAEMMHKYNDEADRDAERAVADCINEFAKVDPASDSFRYPVSTKGIPTTIQFDRVDLVRLKDVIEGISGYFDGTDGMLSSYDSDNYEGEDG